MTGKGTEMIQRKGDEVDRGEGRQSGSWKKADKVESGVDSGEQYGDKVESGVRRENNSERLWLFSLLVIA